MTPYRPRTDASPDSKTPVSLSANPFARFDAALFEQQVWMLSDALGAGIEEVRIEQVQTR